MLGIRRLVEIAFFVTIITVLELQLSFLPNISTTTVLFAVYFANRKIYESTVLIISYILLQGVIWSFGFYLISMTVAWFIWILLVRLANNLWDLVLVGALFGSLYGIAFMPLTVLIYGIDPWAYLIADIPFQVNMIISNVLTILILFPVLDKTFSIATQEAR